MFTHWQIQGFQALNLRMMSAFSWVTVSGVFKKSFFSNIRCWKIRGIIMDSTISSKVKLFWMRGVIWHLLYVALMAWQLDSINAVTDAWYKCFNHEVISREQMFRLILRKRDWTYGSTVCKKESQHDYWSSVNGIFFHARLDFKLLPHYQRIKYILELNRGMEGISFFENVISSADLFQITDIFYFLRKLRNKLRWQLQ